MNQDNEEIIYAYADKFIELANELSQEERIGIVGVAIRYAAARYSAFEASLRTDNLAAEEDKHLQFFAKTFTEMLEKNFAEYSKSQSENKTG